MVLLDARGQFQGTLFFTYYSGQAVANVMDRLGFGAMAVGNHEFADGPETLARFAERIDFPLPAAKMDVSAEPHLVGLVVPWTVLAASAVAYLAARPPVVPPLEGGISRADQ